MSDELPTIIDADKDPIETLRMMARFVSDNRGIAKIVVQGESNEHESLLIGYAVLCKQPEKSAIPIYECATRKVEHMKLADWLLARGHEVSAVEWRQGNSWIYRLDLESVRWVLFIRRPAVPALPELGEVTSPTVMMSGAEGAITGVRIMNAGAGYTSAPQVQRRADPLIARYFGMRRR